MASTSPHVLHSPHCVLVNHVGKLVPPTGKHGTLQPKSVSNFFCLLFFPTFDKGLCAHKHTLIIIVTSKQAEIINIWLLIWSTAFITKSLWSSLIGVCLSLLSPQLSAITGVGICGSLCLSNNEKVHYKVLYGRQDAVQQSIIKSLWYVDRILEEKKKLN